MKKILVTFFLIILVTGLTGCSSKQTAGQNSSANRQKRETGGGWLTAQEAYQKLKKANLDLPVDRKLSFVSNRAKMARQDGRAQVWNFYFYSSTEKQSYLVEVDGNKVGQPKKTSDTHRRALDEKWLDSTKIATQVNEQCQGSPDKKYVFYLTKTPSQLMWVVNCFPDSGQRSIRLNAQTGEIL